MKIGIDLGTTYSVVSYLDTNGRAEIATNKEGSRITPSVVFIDDDAIVVGQIAKDEKDFTPEAVFDLVKRSMGEKVTFDYNDKKYTPEQLSSFILKKLVLDTEHTTGKKVEEVVITVPAYFNDAQRQATKDAAAIAGLKVERVINEPTAAALAYGIQNSKERENILIYDFGGGTFDITLLKLENNQFDVIASDGDHRLGGADMDHVIYTKVSDIIEDIYNIDVDDDDELSASLRLEVERVKKLLSVKSKETIKLKINNRPFKEIITREEFESDIKGLIEKSLTYVNACLYESGYEKEEIDKVLLVGGTTRIPLVVKMVKDMFGEKVSAELNPDEVVAQGAAILASQKELKSNTNTGLTELQNAIVEVELMDTLSHGIGHIYYDTTKDESYNEVLFKKNSPIPNKHRSSTYPVYDNQKHINFRITEGDDRDVDYVDVIGSTLISLPKGATSNYRIEYDVLIDESGFVHVELFEAETNKLLGELDIVRNKNLGKDMVEKLQEEVGLIEIR